MGETSIVQNNGQAGGGGCAVAAVAVVICLALGALLLSAGQAAGAVAAVKQAEAASVRTQAEADALRLRAQADADAVRLRAQAEADRAAAQADGLASGIRDGVTIIAGAVAVAIMAGAFYLLLVAWQRQQLALEMARLRGRMVDVTPQLEAPSMAPSLPTGQRVQVERPRPAIGGPARRVSVGDRVSREG